MDFSRHDYLTADNLLLAIWSNVGDKEGKKLYRGWYEAEMQAFMEEIGFDTMFFERREEVLLSTITNGQWDMPRGTFNVKEAYAYCGDICGPGTMVKLWHKHNFYTEGGRVVAKNRQDGSHDPYFRQYHYYNRVMGSNYLFQNGPSKAATAHYYSVENGVMMISNSVLANFEKLHVRMSGIPVIFGDAPLIPSVMRQACIDFVSEAAARAMIALESDTQRYTYLQRLYENRLDRNGFRGSWHSAANKIARMSSGERNDFAQYIGRWTYING